MEINVNVKLSGDPELMVTLATLVESIQGVLHASKTVADGVAQKVPEIVQETPEVVQNAPEVAQTAPVVAQPVAQPAPAVPTVPTAPAKNYTWAEIQTACAPLIDGGAAQQALMALLPKYNVPSLTAIPPERYGELVVDLRALGAKL